MQNINWYPGHMKKTKDMIMENLKAVDIVIEVIDSRIPLSSRNPVIDEILGGKPRIIALNKMDLSDIKENRKWLEHYKSEYEEAVLVDSNKGKGVSELEKILARMQEEKNRDAVRKKNLRIMIVGVPNSGKSSLINRLTGRKAARTGNKPGVTRGKQWLNLKNGVQLLDTPGILWPKFEDPETGLNLAFCGSIKDEILDRETLALELIKVLGKEYPQMLKDRYKLDEISEDGLENMENIAKKRGFIMSGKRIDWERCAKTVLDEYRSGKIGCITFEKLK